MYAGSADEWLSVGIDSGNDSLDKAVMHYAKEGNTITAVARGVCGTSLSWYLTDGGLLVIQGSGRMPDYAAWSPANQPWKQYVSRIKSVIVGSGVTNIGSGAFLNCPVTKAYLSETVVSIGLNAFSGTDSVTVYYGGNSVSWNSVMIAYGNSALSAGAVRFHANGIPLYDITSISYSGEMVTAFVSTASPATVYCAFYDTESRMLDVKSTKLATGEDRSLTFSCDPAADYVKVFLLNESGVPLCAAEMARREYFN